MEQTSRIVKALALLPLGALGACTTLKVSEPTSDYRTRQGIVYYLPFTQFEVTSTWTASCDDAGALSLTPKFDAKPISGADPKGVYVIDYRSLSAVTKTSNVKVDFYDSGAIKAINASADDRTGEVLSKLISGVGKIGKLMATGGGNGTDEAKCSADLLTALGQIEKAQGKVDSKTEELKRQTRVLDGLTATVVREGAALSRGTRAALGKQVGEVVALQLELDAVKKELEDKTEAAIYSGKLTFPGDSTKTLSDDSIKAPAKVLKTWIARRTNETDQQFESRTVGYQAAEAVWFELEPRADFARPLVQQAVDAKGNAKSSPQPNAEAGIRYRIGVPAFLKACKGNPCKAGGAVLTPGKVVKSLPVTMTQAQSTFFLPFSSKIFTNAALTANFSETGVLTSAGYEQKKAPAEVVAGLLDDAAGQTATILQAARDAKKTEVELVEEQTKLAKAQKALADAKAALEEAPNTSETRRTAALNAQNTLRLAEVASVNAEIAMIEAQKKLALAQAAGGQ